MSHNVYPIPDEFQKGAYRTEKTLPDPSVIETLIANCKKVSSHAEVEHHSDADSYE